MLSWHVKKHEKLSDFTSNCHGTCFNRLRASRSLPYLKFGVTEAWESTEIENTIYFEPHTFHIFRILARLAAFVSAWFDIEIRMILCF